MPSFSNAMFAQRPVTLEGEQWAGLLGAGGGPDPVAGRGVTTGCVKSGLLPVKDFVHWLFHRFTGLVWTSFRQHCAPYIDDQSTSNCLPAVLPWHSDAKAHTQDRLCYRRIGLA